MRAILSVSNKTGIEELGTGLDRLGIEIYATGGTWRALDAAGLPVRAVSDLTGFPEILGGRVKTLHPAVYGGILARRDVPGDLAELDEHRLATIDLVAVNLYPFEQTVAQPDTTVGAALEQIDIGGPALLRAAAKNHPAVLPLCDPADYGAALEALAQPVGHDGELRRRLAAKAFYHVSVYDALIGAYLFGDEEGWPEEMALGLRKLEVLRYGENPQQRAAFYAAVQPQRAPGELLGARQLQGKPMSYTNILDAGAAWEIACDFHPLAIAIIKHTNPCGLAQGQDPQAVYELALAGDPLAAFGGIVASNAPVDGPLARRLVERFYEIVLAPAFSQEALEALAARPDLRVLALPAGRSRPRNLWRSAGGGMLVQEADQMGGDEVRRGRVATQRAPSGEEWAALSFAWRAVRHVKSNAIVLAQGAAPGSPGGLALVGMGAGQPSRVAAVEIAIQRAGARAGGSVLASDAFFPKADGIVTAARAGVRAIVQPGGSRGDEETIAAADAEDMAMVFTGTRHFSH